MLVALTGGTGVGGGRVALRAYERRGSAGRARGYALPPHQAPGGTVGPRLRTVARHPPAVDHQRPRERAHPVAGALALLVPRRPGVRGRPLSDAAGLGRGRRAGVRLRRRAARCQRGVRARGPRGPDLRGVPARHRSGRAVLAPPDPHPTWPRAGGGPRVRPARCRRSHHERPGPDAGRGKRDARQRDRVSVRHQTAAVRGRLEAVPVTAAWQKKPNPGLKAPRAGGRAKWPSHFGRDLYSLTRCTGPSTEGFTQPSPNPPVLSFAYLDAHPPQRVAPVTNVSLCPP